jgi:hypothetical protein
MTLDGRCNWEQAGTGDRDRRWSHLDEFPETGPGKPWRIKLLLGVTQNQKWMEMRTES